jgi:hypothetical protein
MKILISLKYKFSVITLLFFTSIIFAQNKVDNNILIIDNTKSMVGYGGSPAIWDDVKSFINQYVDSVNKGNIITVYTFATDLSSPAEFTIKSKNDKTKVKKYINAIQATGLNTCIANALEKTISELDKNKRNTILLFTDGNENCTNNFSSLIKQYNLRKGDVNNLYFIPFNPSNFNPGIDVLIKSEPKGPPPPPPPTPKKPKKTFNIEIK